MGYSVERIEELRQLMYDLIAKEKDLLNVEVIRVSQQLDLALNEYNRLLINIHSSLMK